MSMNIIPPTKGDDDSGAPRDIARLWAGCGQAAGNRHPSSDTTDGSAGRASATQTDEAAVARCLTKRTLAAYLLMSVRSLDRANALGLLPSPDLVVGRS